MTRSEGENSEFCEETSWEDRLSSLSTLYSHAQSKYLQNALAVETSDHDPAFRLGTVGPVEEGGPLEGVLLRLLRRLHERRATLHFWDGGLWLWDETGAVDPDLRDELQASVSPLARLLRAGEEEPECWQCGYRLWLSPVPNADRFCRVCWGLVIGETEVSISEKRND